MRLGKGLQFLLPALLLLTSSAMADIPINERVSLDGNIRLRTFYDERDFDAQNTNAAYYGTMRTMIGFKIQATDDVLFRTKLRDSRYMGVPYTQADPGDYDATILNTQNSSSLALQEGYVFATGILGSGFDFQLGRFEMEYGRGRILGPGAWNVEGPRTYDGFRFMWHQPGVQVDLFGSILRDYSFGSYWPDYRPPASYHGGVYTFDPNAGYVEMKRYLGGISASFADGAIQPLLLVDFDSHKIGFENTPGDPPDDQSKEPQFYITPALYSEFTMSEDGGNRWEFEIDIAGQFGQTNSLGAHPGSYDVVGFLAAFETRIHANDESDLFFGLGFDITGRGEGDEDPRDAYTFFQFYYTQHKFRGYMDYFYNVQNGLVDVYATMGVHPMSWFSMMVNVHNFNYLTYQGRELDDGSLDQLRQLGQEIDLLARFKIKKGFYLDVGYSAFIPTDEFATRVNRTVFTPGSEVAEPLSHYAYLVFTTKF